MTTKRIIICTGGNLGDWIKRWIQPDDLLVGADRGAWYLVKQGYRLELAIGDFDSVTPGELNEISEKSRLLQSCDPVNKDLTDTEMAFEWALSERPTEILLLGALGTRFDHSLANIHLLIKGLREGISCKIIDKYNEISLVRDRLKLLKNTHYSYVSLLPMSLEVYGVTLRGFQYPLHNASLYMGQTRGISNVLRDECGTIEVKEGWLLVIQSRDET